MTGTSLDLSGKLDPSRERVFRDVAVASAALGTPFFISAQGGFLDIVPFGGVEDSTTRSIAWPPDYSVVMSALGFEEAYQHAVSVRFAHDLAVKDLKFILSEYLRAGNEERGLLARRADAGQRQLGQDGEVVAGGDGRRGQKAKRARLTGARNSSTVFQRSNKSKGITGGIEAGMKKTTQAAQATTELRLALAAGEGQYVEFKEQVSDGLARELVAFANGGGGGIYVGIADNRQIKGLKITNRLLSQVQDIARKCEPPISVTLVPFKYRGVELLRILVDEGGEKPYGCSAGYFLRTGPSSQKMNRGELVRFLRGVGEVRFDEMPCEGFRYPADFSAAAFRSFLGAANITSKGLAREDLLINLGLAARRGRSLVLNNAGTLFFARQPRRFHLQSRITCLLFQGTQKTHILDRRDFDGRLPENVDEAMKFLRQHLPVRYEITSLHRREIPALPEAALREAVLNAVIHRDYFERGGVVMVELYQDRLQIINPGGLPPGLRLEDLGRFSLPRNPLLADLFLRLGYVERAGSGIARIRAAIAEAGLPEPEFESNFFFTVRFPLLSGSPQKDAAKEVRSGAKSGTKSGAKSGPATQQASVLQFCQTPQPLTELMALFGRSDRTKFRQNVIEPLLEAGWLARTVPDRPRSRFQQYVTTPAGRKQLAHQPAKLS